MDASAAPTHSSAAVSACSGARRAASDGLPSDASSASDAAATAKCSCSKRSAWSARRLSSVRSLSAAWRRRRRSSTEAMRPLAFHANACASCCRSRERSCSIRTASRAESTRDARLAKASPRSFTMSHSRLIVSAYCAWRLVRASLVARLISETWMSISRCSSRSWSASCWCIVTMLCCRVSSSACRTASRSLNTSRRERASSSRSSSVTLSCTTPSPVPASRAASSATGTASANAFLTSAAPRATRCVTIRSAVIFASSSDIAFSSVSARCTSWKITCGASTRIAPPSSRARAALFSARSSAASSSRAVSSFARRASTSARRACSS
mmetsp:Transcript_24248/g.57799  ORF Transcript_24248/g.57799 Transcript_24248/m.57799 type:complete len:327 (+) Transcript_24248:366-1346(+)